MVNQDADELSSRSKNKSDRKVTIRAARKMLGMVGRNYSDEDIQKVLHILYGMAEEAYEVFQSEKDAEN